MTKSLIIFMRNPVPGQVKSRLAKSIGAQAAFEVYLELLDHTRKITVDLSHHKALYYDREIDSEDLWPNNKYDKHLQKGEDLGAKMQQAFEAEFNHADQVVIIGSDCGTITTDHINRAFDLLDESDVAIGPAEDGGFYLLGLCRPMPFLFEDKAWGTAEVLPALSKDFEQHNLIVASLPVLNDIDTEEDLVRWKTQMIAHD